MTPQEALHLGLGIARVGIPFRGMDILAAAGQGAEPSGALAARIATQTNAFRARNGETIQGVFQVEAILGKNGLERPERPQALEGFARWAGGASKAASAAVPPESPAAAALLVGGFLGDLLAAVALGIMALSMLDVARDHAFLTAQVAKLAAGATEATSRLAMAARHPALDAAARPIVDKIIALAGSPAGAGDGGANPGARADAEKQTYAAIDQETARLGAVFAVVPS